MNFKIIYLTKHFVELIVQVHINAVLSINKSLDIYIVIYIIVKKFKLTSAHITSHPLISSASDHLYFNERKKIIKTITSLLSWFKLI